MTTVKPNTWGAPGRLRARLLALSFLITTATTGFPESLKDIYQGDFMIGSTIGNQGGKDPSVYPIRYDDKERAVLKEEFNSLTPENLMKWEYLQPSQGVFNFKHADKVMAFAEKNGQAVVGHTLVWHAQLADWVFKDEHGNPVSRDVLIKRMRDHIYTVVGRYKGKIKYWDVVNEAVDTRMVIDESQPRDKNGNPKMKRVAFYRQSPWLKIIGEEYIEMAFRFAHEADPEARLLYNDYSMTDLEKAEFVAKMIRGLKGKKVPIHGVGMQSHWHLQYPPINDIEAAIKILSASGVKVSITELDIGILPLAHDHQGADISVNVALRDELNPYKKSAPDEVLQRQAKKYTSIFQLLLANREHIERVTFWGVSDKYSWLNDYPVTGRTAYPLLFDRDFKPKPALRALKKLK